MIPVPKKFDSIWPLDCSGTQKSSGRHSIDTNELSTSRYFTSSSQSVSNQPTYQHQSHHVDDKCMAPSASNNCYHPLGNIVHRSVCSSSSNYYAVSSSSSSRREIQTSACVPPQRAEHLFFSAQQRDQRSSTTRLQQCSDESSSHSQTLLGKRLFHQLSQDHSPYPGNCQSPSCDVSSEPPLARLSGGASLLFAHKMAKMQQQTSLTPDKMSTVFNDGEMRSASTRNDVGSDRSVKSVLSASNTTDGGLKNVAAADIGLRNVEAMNATTKKSFTVAADSGLNNVEAMSSVERTQLVTELQQCKSTSMTLVYSDGSTQLRDLPQAKTRNSTQESTVTALAIVYIVKNDSKYFYLPFQNSNHQLYEWSRVLIDELMSSTSQRLCFDGQELIQALVMHYSFNEKKVITRWSIYDPKIAAWLLNADQPPVTFQQTLKLFSVHIEDADLKGGNIRSDLDWLHSLGQRMRSHLMSRDLWSLFVNIETPLVSILALLELRGINVDLNAMKQSGELLQKRLCKLEILAHKSAGRAFLINSHTQLREVLFDKLKLDAQLPQQQKIAKTAAGNLKSTSEVVLKQLSHLHPLPGLVLDYRQTQKLKSTYVEGIMAFVKNGLLTSHWDQTAAATGRLTSTSPNIQAIPRLAIDLAALTEDETEGNGSNVCYFAREPFISQPGCVFLAADFQQIELRILAHLSNDPSMIDLFSVQQTEDVFKLLTAHWLSKPIAAVSQFERERTKRVVYSVMYGAGKEKLAEILGIDCEEASNIMQSFLVTFPGVKSFSRKCMDETRKKGYNVTLFKRRRLFPHINSSNFHQKSYSERQAVNFCVQGSAADLCKAAMIQVEQALATNSDLRTRLLVQIHDELLLEVPEHEIPTVAALVKKIMESSETLCRGLDITALRVPLRVSISFGSSWAHMQQCIAMTS